MAFSETVLNNPVAQSVFDLITTEQIWEIRAMGRNKDINSEEHCMELLKCRVHELSQKAASEFTQYLSEQK